MSLFGISETHSEPPISLDEYCELEKPSVFLFRMDSSDMFPRIWKGDLLIVDRAKNPRLNDVVLVEVENEYLCRQYAKGKLCALNPKVRDIVITAELEIRIFGVVCSILGVCKKYDSTC